MSTVVSAPEIAPESVRPLRRAEYDALVARPGAVIRPVAFPAVELEVGRILPRRG